MKLQTHLHAGQSTRHRFAAHLTPGSDPIRVLAEDHFDAAAQITLRHAPGRPWTLYLWIEGQRVGEWQITPPRPRESHWPSQSCQSDELEARVVGL